MCASSSLNQRHYCATIVDWYDFFLCVDSVWVGLLLVGVVMILFSTCCLLRLAYCGIHCYMHTLIAHPIALGM